MPREQRAVDRHHPRNRHDGRDRAGDRRRPGSTTRPIVLTGAMVPYAFGSSDGLFNLGSALSFAQVLPPGVYVAMNGQHFGWDEVRKNRERGVFERRPVMIQLASRLPSVGTTIFTVMSRLAADVGAINLSQGFPDFDCDPALIEAVARHMRAGRNQYAPMPGVLALREAIASDVSDVARTGLRSGNRGHDHLRRHGGDLRRGRRVRAPGDEVIVLEPCYDSYVPAIELSGGVPVVVSLRYPDYSVDWDAVRRAITPRTRLLMINTPHNPTGVGAHRRRHARAGRDRRRHRRPRARRRGLPAHHLRRPPPREPGARMPRSPPAASSSARSARRITPPAGRSGTPWPRRP